MSTFAVIAAQRLVTASSDIAIARRYQQRGEGRVIFKLDRNGARIELEAKGGGKVFIRGIEVPG